MHLMPAQGLISSSLQYGVVSRSLPFTGRILRGYLDAAGSGTGLGIGNPNTEFTPNVSACALGADGGTAKIVWGFRNGEVAFTVANKAMDAGSRSAAKFLRCSVGDEHQGAVLDVIWDGSIAITSGGDGRVKVWDAKKARCVWTSDSRFPDECIKVASALGRGIVAGAMRSGDTVVWGGFAYDMPDGPTSVDMLIIPCPIRDEGSSREISTIYIDSCNPSPTLLVAFEDNAHFYRFGIDFTNKVIECAQFGDPSLGAITSLAPFFTDQPGEFSLVITGTKLGCVGIYDWTAPDMPFPTHKFEATDDGAAITALAWNGLVLVTGCARGTTRVWDALTLTPLRAFASPIPRKRPALHIGGPPEDPAVRQIVLGPEKEVLLVAVGDRVMAWRAGPVPRGGLKMRGAPGKKRDQRMGTSKYYQQLELKQAVVESRHMLDEESRHVQRAYGREREQRARLETLGLDEVEAVEYVLMLSREEAIERERALGEGAPVDQGVFDFDDEGSTLASADTAGSTRSPSPTSPWDSPSTPPRSVSSSPPWSTPGVQGQRILCAAPSSSPSNSKIQVSPPFRAEPSEASFTPPARSVPPAAVGTHFPPIGSGASASVVGGTPSTNSSPRGTLVKSAWSTPLARSPVPSPGSSMSASVSAQWDGRVSRSSSSSAFTVPEDDMDGDLLLAIALSLADVEHAD
ncbi:hypothetical protein B0H15DRAFT_789790 [Mycena belliarum]|uniref:WD40 repeat-like protein n=1 Tax=Mycena belliarum TaxID=1033014 RepID=A0AAD6XIP9_9AGAR|nr:hypothetical protein B0H15DRAFT_789790 [Mycena belliae]